MPLDLMFKRRGYMRSRRSLISTAAFALALVLTGGLGTAQAAPAGDLVTVQEFRTGGEAGYFYTSNATEAGNAVSKHKFTKNGDIGRLHSQAGSGRDAVHRLRLKTGGPSYMLSKSPSEWSDARFADEGVIGYVDRTQQPGQRQLLRFSNNNKWRALSDAPANVDTLTGQGWKKDGALGWYTP